MPGDALQLDLPARVGRAQPELGALDVAAANKTGRLTTVTDAVAAQVIVKDLKAAGIGYMDSQMHKSSCPMRFDA